MQFYKKKNTVFILLLFLISFAIRIYYIPFMPLYGDEAAYAEVINEFIRNPSLIPHFMGHIISWKPPLGFAVYSLIINAVWALNRDIPVEVAYRIPPLIFGVLSTLAMYFMVRKLYGEETAFLSSLVFTTSAISLALSEVLLLDTLVLFLLISGVVLYMEGEEDTRYFYYAGLVGALLFLTKSIIAFLLPALAISYYVGERSISKDAKRGRAFLLSLSAVPLAMFLYALLFFLHAPPGRGADITVSYVYDLFFRVSYGTRTEPWLITHTIEFLKLTVPWCILLFSGFLLTNLRDRRDRFIFLWLLLMLVFLGASQFYSWYYLPVMPPFSVICARVLLKIKRNRFFLPLLLLLFLLSFPYIANPDFMNSYLRLSPINAERMQAGIFLRDKSNILSITERGIPEIVFYKFYGESKPNYSTFEMVVLDPFAVTSYTAYPFLSDVVLGNAHKRNITEASEVKAIIENSSKKDYVLMDANTFKVYSQSPISTYSLAFNSSYGSYVVLERAR